MLNNEDDPKNEDDDLNEELDDFVRLRDILVIDDGNLPAAVDALRDLIATSGQFYDRDGPVEIVTDPNGAPVIKKLTKSNIVYIAHQLCQPMKLNAKGVPKRITLPARILISTARCCAATRFAL